MLMIIRTLCETAVSSDEIKDARFYEPGVLGYEEQIRAYLKKIREE